MTKIPPRKFVTPGQYVGPQLDSSGDLKLVNVEIDADEELKEAAAIIQKQIEQAMQQFIGMPMNSPTMNELNKVLSRTLATQQKQMQMYEAQMVNISINGVDANLINTLFFPGDGTAIKVIDNAKRNW